MPIYMKHGSVTGNAKQANHDGWTQLQSLQFGINRPYSTNTGAGKNREGGQISFSEIMATKMVEDSTTDLIKMSLTGDTGETTTIDITTTAEGSDEQTIVQITLKESLVATMSTSGAGGSGADRPYESFTLAFTDIEFKFVAQAVEGSEATDPFITGFNLATNISR
jgi:type VI secretion system Hcp family effector